MLPRNKAAFTLLECLCAMMFIGCLFLSLPTIVQQVEKTNSRLAGRAEKEWELFLRQLAYETKEAALTQVTQYNLYFSDPTIENREIVIRRYQADKIRKTTGNNKGHQLLLTGLKDARFSEEGEQVKVEVEFLSGEKFWTYCQFETAADH